MRSRDLLEGLPAFLAVVEARSFTRGARKLGVSPSAASQAVRSLEARIGTPLLSRSTRSLSLTAAGEAYVGRVGAAFGAIEDATRDAMGRASEPSGLLRITMPRAAYDGVVAPALGPFRARFPQVTFELEIEGGLVDITAKGFDAGLRYGHLLARDMQSVEVLGASMAVLVAAPGYLAGRPQPTDPDDLKGFDAVVCRSRTTGTVSSWQLLKGRRSWRHDPADAIIASDLTLQLDMTIAGHGISCAPLQCVREALEDGRLVPVLSGWSSPLQPLHLYHPRHTVANAALRAFVDHLIERRSPSS